MLFRRYFAKHFAFVIEQEIAARKARAELKGLESEKTKIPLGRRLTRVFTRRNEPLTAVPEDGLADDDEKSEKREGGLFRPFSKKSLRKLRPDMIRRMDDAPKPIDPSGWISHETATVTPHRSRAPSVATRTSRNSDRQSRTNG